MRVDQARRRVRRRRQHARWLLRRLPRRATIGRYPLIGRFAHRLQAPHFWTWSGRPVVLALYSAAVVSFLPLAGVQILLAVLLAIALRANLPLAVGIQFVSNPLTAVPMYGLTLATGWWPAEQLLGTTGAALKTATALGIGGLACGLLAAAAVHAALVVREHQHRRDLALLRRADRLFRS